MHHFFEAITNTRGDALIGYYVKVFDSGGSQQSLYADTSLTPIVSVSGIADTALVDSNGMASFYIAPGSYTFVVYATNGTTEVNRLTDVPMGDTGNPLIDSIGGLTFGADNYIYGTASNTAAAGTITTAGRALIDDASATAQRTTLGATTAGSNVFTITNPGAISFLRFNADNTVDALSAAAFRTAIGAGVGGGDLVSTNNLSDVTTPATAATNLGLGTGSSPQFTAVNIGHASDTTITRIGAGDIAVEGNAIYRASGTDVALADGGTGASLSDPNADRIMFWDDSAGAVAFLAPSTGLTITTTNLTVDQTALKPTEHIQIACSDESTAITTGTAKVTFRMPYAFTVTDVRASVNTAPTGSTILIDINEGGTTILSTKLMIDASEKTSTTAATPYVLSDTSLADDAEMTIDFDQVGSTIAGKGVKVVLIGTRT